VDTAILRSHHSENLPFNLGSFSLISFDLRREKRFEVASKIRALQPFGDSKSVLLVGRSSFARESPVPKGRLDFGDHWATELRVRTAKSVLHFDVQGSVAESTHAGVPMAALYLATRQRRPHFWPLDGGSVPPNRAAPLPLPSRTKARR
jgi:hypothetical protein